MLTVAREFNYSETVFLRQDQDGQLSMNIFTPADEIKFAGHPVIGTGHVLFHRLLPGINLPDPLPETISVTCQAGPVVLEYDAKNDTVRANVPHNVHVHSKGTPKQNILDTQPKLVDQASQLKDDYPAVSIVKGVTYTLVEMTEQEELFASVAAGKCQETELDEDWAPSFTGTLYYCRGKISMSPRRRVEHLRVRMIAIDLEDPATGSACCSLAAYLALQVGKPTDAYRFVMSQGSEIGRESSIIVDVNLKSDGKEISKMFLSGPATVVAEGAIRLP